MIRFKNLTKRYDTGKGIYDFSFEVEEGEVFGLIGPKASGKSTALRMLMGFEGSTKGRCAINGRDCAKAGLSLHKITGYLPQNPSLPFQLTGRQFLRSIADMRGLRNLERLFELAGRLDLNVDEKIGRMSSGEVQKTAIICSLMHSPQVILLDCPFKNLESRARSELVDILLEEKEKNRMILLATDMLDCADMSCDRVGLLDKGNLVYLGDIENLRENMHRNYQIQFASGRNAMQFANEKFEIKSMKDRNVVVSIQGELLPLVKTLANYKVTGMESVPLDLEDTFVHIYGGRLHA